MGTSSSLRLRSDTPMERCASCPRSASKRALATSNVCPTSVMRASSSGEKSLSPARGGGDGSDRQQKGQRAAPGARRP